MYKLNENQVTPTLGMKEDSSWPISFFSLI